MEPTNRFETFCTLIIDLCKLFFVAVFLGLFLYIFL